MAPILMKAQGRKLFALLLGTAAKAEQSQDWRNSDKEDQGWGA